MKEIYILQIFADICISGAWMVAGQILTELDIFKVPGTGLVGLLPQQQLSFNVH